jgi:hypothetical protein
MLTKDIANQISRDKKVIPFAIDTNQPHILIVEGRAIIIVIVINTVLALLSIPTRYM